MPESAPVTCRNCSGGTLTWLHPFRAAAIVVAPWFPLRGQIGFYHAKFSIFSKFRSTCIGSVIFWGSLLIFWLADAEAIKIVGANRELFRKDLVGVSYFSVIL
ncbi:hypothetical protein C8J57DRAFT_1086779 [Mycena rebaudengoi]|nr:hypothetical protein C8J57DRAFT_1086779 [Mycena rebaudengoi]